MAFFKRLDRTRRLDDLIRKQATGPPEALARRMGVSQATIYRWLQELKEFGLPVKYSRERKTYLYERGKPPSK